MCFLVLKMASWNEVSSIVPDMAILRRVLFAAAHIPTSVPRYPEIVCEFAFQSAKHRPEPEKVRVLLENISFMNEKAFKTDKILMKDLLSLQQGRGHPLGITLISENDVCKSCGGVLQLRSDRPSFLTIYTEDMGTVPATAYRKYCKSSHKGCTFTQHYGFHFFNIDGKSRMVADDNWAELPYFVSSSKTGFATAFLEKFDAELLVGHLSYKQKADIYNIYHKYDKVQKKKPKKSISQDGQSDDLSEDEEDDTSDIRYSKCELTTNSCTYMTFMQFSIPL